MGREAMVLRSVSTRAASSANTRDRCGVWKSALLYTEPGAERVFRIAPIAVFCCFFYTRIRVPVPTRIMSTAIMSRYDFGDSLIKGAVGGRDPTPGGHLDLGSPGMRFALTRMASTPATGSTSAASSTAASNLTTLLLGNLTQHRRLERAQSAPAPSAAVSATTVNTSRYKTELCRPYEEFGVCKYGDKCQFAHGGAELRSLARHPKYKTELCRTYHTVGFCPYGPRCHFVHNQDEVAAKQPIMARRPRPAALSPTLSLDSPSPPCSLSQSPTSSMGSFFSSEPELHSPTDDQRLPVFNRLSAVQLLSLTDLVL